jgi:hypothetical protein
VQGARERELKLELGKAGFAFMDRKVPIPDEEFQMGFIKVLVAAVPASCCSLARCARTAAQLRARRSAVVHCPLLL